MSYFVIIQNNVVHWSDTLTKPNSLPYKVPLNALITPAGFVVPMCYTSFNIFDYFDGSKAHIDTFALIIGRNGDVYEYAFDGISGTMERRRIPISEESIYIRSMNRDHEALLTGMIYGGMSAGKALQLLAKERTDFSLHGYTAWPLTKIKAGLKIIDAVEYPPLFNQVSNK